MPLITVEVTADIAEKIRFMAEQGVFGIIDGSAELHFKKGRLGTVMTKRISYSQVDKVEISPILHVSA